MGRARLTTRRLVLFALLEAILVGLQVVMAAFPNIEAVSLLIMVYTVVFGGGVAYIIAGFVVLEMLLWGFNTWVISYCYVWAVLAILAWLFRGMESRLGWAILSGAYGLSFGALCALVYLPIGGPAMFVATWVAGIPFVLLQCAGNFAMALLLFQPCRRVLTALWQRMGDQQ